MTGCGINPNSHHSAEALAPSAQFCPAAAVQKSRPFGATALIDALRLYLVSDPTK
jgi:hypothetical protein